MGWNPGIASRPQVYKPAVRKTPVLPSTPETDDGLEELDMDSALIAHESAAHLPQPRANVVVAEPSVVIQEDAAPGQPTRSQESTVVIRDRRKVEDLRRELRHQEVAHRRQRRRSILLWSAASVLAFSAGGAAALWMNARDRVADTRSHEVEKARTEPARAAVTTQKATAQSPTRTQAAPPAAEAKPASPEPEVSQSERVGTSSTVSLEELPLE